MRSDDRQLLRRPVRARFLGAGRHALHGDLRDLSPDGVSLVLDPPLGLSVLEAPPEPLSEVFLQFLLPAGPIEAVSEVRWVKRQRDGRTLLGLRFIRMPMTCRRVITEALSAPRAARAALLGDWVLA